MAVVLTINVGKHRMEEKRTLWYEKGTNLERAVRSHANFLEYTPLFLVALTAAESVGACAVSTNVIGATFMIGRVLHAVSLNHYETVHKSFALRKASMMMTILPFIILAIFLIAKSFKCCRKEEPIACDSKGNCSKCSK